MPSEKLALILPAIFALTAFFKWDNAVKFHSSKAGIINEKKHLYYQSS